MGSFSCTHHAVFVRSFLYLPGVLFYVFSLTQPVQFYVRFSLKYPMLFYRIFFFFYTPHSVLWVGWGRGGGVLLLSPCCFIKGISLIQPVLIVQELCESQAGRPGLSVLTSLLVFRGHKDILNHALALVSACP